MPDDTSPTPLTAQPSVGPSLDLKSYDGRLAEILADGPSSGADSSFDNVWQDDDNDVDEDGHHDDDDFVYPGSSQHESTNGSADSAPASYTEMIKAALGSEDSTDQEDSPTPATHDDGDQDLTLSSHAGDSSELADQTMASIGSMLQPGQFRYRVNPRHSFNGSIASSSQQAGSVDSRSRQRPPEYPTVSRLRSQGVSRPPSFSLRSASSFSPFPSLGGLFPTSSSHSDLRPSASHSRSTSLSSLPGPSKRQLYPYGLEPLSDAASTSSPQSSAIGQRYDPQQLSNASHSHSIVERGLFKWSALKKAAMYFQKGGKRPSKIPIPTSGQTLPESTGSQTAFVVGTGSIAVGTTQGYTLVFDFSQDLRCFCGNDGIGQSAGPVTSLAFSSDHTFIAVGHARGHVYLYDLTKPASPARHVPPVTPQEIASGRKEGHLEGSNILHVGFVGTRHTAVLTADDCGLAFYHSLGRIFGVASNDTLRILGRYPERPSPPVGSTNGSAGPGKRKRQSPPILSMSPLPLGPVDHPSNALHYVALATAHKVVVVGLKPNARTWYRKSAPLPPGQDTELQGSTQANGNVEGSVPPPHHPPTTVQQRMTACTAWHPAFQASETSSCTDSTGFVEPRLAFAFGANLWLLRLHTRKVKVPSTDPRKPEQSKIELDFAEQSLGTDGGESIEAMEWLSHELLLLLTATHLKLFDLRLGKVTEQENVQPSLSGLKRLSLRNGSLGDGMVTPLAQHSMQINHGKAFFATQSQVVVGHLLSWADRLLVLVGAGDFLSAIELATAYYRGTVPGSLVGLPEDAGSRQRQVGIKLQELMSASARYTFSPDRLTDATHVTSDGRGVDRTDLFAKLTQACTEACLALGDTRFLFDDLFDLFADNGIEGLFVEQMEPFIINGQLKQLPIPVTQRLISSCVKYQDYSMAETIIWHVDAMCLDLDQVITLCSRQSLFDALIYVYNAALQDFVSPIVELLQASRRKRAQRQDDDRGDSTLDSLHGDAEDFSRWRWSEVYKIFSYLSVVFSGLSFPSREVVAPEVAHRAKSALYDFVLSGHCIVWPPGQGGQLIMPLEVHIGDMSTYPYLRSFLGFDSEAFLDVLDIAFEDVHLDDDDSDSGFPGERLVSRQALTNILLEVMTSLESADGVFVAIFVARNAPKYPQFIRLSPTTVIDLLSTLSQSDLGEDTREDRQLAAESLLSAYKVDYSDATLSMFQAAGFWRILQSAYRVSARWGPLMAMYLRDIDSSVDVFGQLTDVLTKATGKTTSDELYPILLQAVPILTEASAEQTALLVDHFYPDRHSEVLEAMESSDHRQLEYLSAFLDPRAMDSIETSQPSRRIELNKSHPDPLARELYISLLLRLQPQDLLRNLDVQDSDYFNLDGVVDSASRSDEADEAVLWALDRQGKVASVFDALDQMVARRALQLNRGGSDGIAEKTLEVVGGQLRKATEMAVRICTERCSPSSATSKGKSPSSSTDPTAKFDADEMWYRVLRSLVSLVHGVASPTSLSSASQSNSGDAIALARDVVQETLSAMAASMSAETVSFPVLFRRLVNAGQHDVVKEGSSSVRYYAEVKTVVEGMTNAYRLRTDLLSITNRLYDRETYRQFASLSKKSRRGWRSNGAPIATSRPDISSDQSTTPRLRSASSISTSTIPATPMSGMTRRTPARGADFLSSSTDTSPAALYRSTSSKGLVVTPGAVKGLGGVPGSPIRLNKGKERARSQDEVVDTESSFSREQQQQQQRGPDVTVGDAYAEDEVSDYFGSTRLISADPIDSFRASPSSVDDEVGSTARIIDREAAAAVTASAAGVDRGPIVVRLGTVR